YRNVTGVQTCALPILARDAVRAIQRGGQGLSELIAGETLATSLEFGSAEGAAQVFDPDELPEGTRLAVSRACAPKRRTVTATGQIGRASCRASEEGSG